jgi:hypothetical protein
VEANVTLLSLLEPVAGMPDVGLHRDRVLLLQRSLLATKEVDRG